MKKIGWILAVVFWGGGLLVSGFSLSEELERPFKPMESKRLKAYLRENRAYLLENPSLMEELRDTGVVETILVVDRISLIDENEVPDIVRWSTRDVTDYTIDYAIWEDGRVIWNAGDRRNVDYRESVLSKEQLQELYKTLDDVLDMSYNRCHFTPAFAMDTMVNRHMLQIKIPEKNFVMAIEKTERGISKEVIEYWGKIHDSILSFLPKNDEGTPSDAVFQHKRLSNLEYRVLQSQIKKSE